MRWSFLYFAHFPPFECKRLAKTSWSQLFKTSIYGPPRRPTVQSPSAAGCMTTTFCPPRPRRIYCPTHADLSLLADRRDAAPHTASCWTLSLVRWSLVTGTVPSTKECCWTAKAYPTLSLQSPGSNIDCLAAEPASSSIGVSHHSEHPLRQSVRFSLQGSRDDPRVWQGRPVYHGPQSCCFVASSGARYASCWNESCRKHTSGSYTTKHSDL